MHSFSYPFLVTISLAVSASAEPIRYRFDHPRQNLQGWTVVSGTAAIEQRGLGVPKLKGEPHATMLVRSPMFRLAEEPVISVSLSNGRGGQIPNSPRGLAAQSVEGGPMGVALRRVTDDAWVVTGQVSRDGNAEQQIQFPRKSLDDLREAAPDEVYTLDFFDGGHGKSGHVQMLLAELNATTVESLPPAPAGYEAARPLFLGAMHGKLSFDKKDIYATPGSKVSLTFFNSDEMAHNWVLCKDEPKVADELGMYVMQNLVAMTEAEFIPKDPRILHHSHLVAPGTSDTQYFTVPSEKGNYPFVCTFPGHHLLMRGIFHVVDELPSPGEGEIQKATTVDPYLITATDRPVILRGPLSGGADGAAVVCVGMPGGVSFSFDTATCAISNVWLADGSGFINTKDAWGGRGGKALRILGKVKFQNGDNPKPGEVRFRGYVVNDDGLPIFEIEDHGAPQRLRVGLAEDGKALLVHHESGKSETRTEKIELAN